MAVRRQRRRRIGLPVVVAAGAAALALAAGVVVLVRIRRANASGRSERMEANKKASRRMVEEFFGAGKYDIADDLVHEDAIGRDPAQPEPIRGIEALKENARGYRAAFPDMKMTVDQAIAEGDVVAVRWTARGTHKGDLFGISPTGKQATVTGITIDRYKGGKIAESWTNWDTLGLLQQLGAVPTALQTA
jgi:steroid delta-isomerase-like uncharacterized protein